MRQWLTMIFLATSIIILSAQDTIDTNVVVIMNGRLIDGTGAEAIDSGIVIVEGERIIAVGATAEINVPENATVIDAMEGTILPGFVNAHTHGATEPRIRYSAFTQRGVTTICDMGSSMSSLVSLTETTLRNGSFAGRTGRSGPFITVEGGYPGPVYGDFLNYTITEAGSPTDAVTDLQAQGASYIKIGLERGQGNLPILTPEEVQEIVNVAHERDMIVHAHIQTAAHLETAIDAGVDVLHHVPIPVDTLQQNAVGTLFTLLGDEEVELSEDLITQLERAVEADILLVPTLDVLVATEEETNQMVQRYGQLAMSVTQEYIALGGRIAVGNDYGNPGILSGMMIREMQLLHEAGLSFEQIITAASYHSAQVCDMADNIGTLEVGKFADLIIVNGNPLEDILILDDIVFIMANGTEIPVRPIRRR